MTYHLPRVMHWLQSESVAHYYTPITRQLYQPPFAEYAIAHIISLTRTDRFAFLVQWLALFGSAVGVSVIARQLGCGPLGQALAATIFVTAPMAILQGSSTQNDLVVTFWIVVVVVCGTGLAQESMVPMPVGRRRSRIGAAHEGHGVDSVGAVHHLAGRRHGAQAPALGDRSARCGRAHSRVSECTSRVPERRDVRKPIRE